MDVLVVGGSGFVGRSVCGVLIDRGHRVTAASRSPDSSDLPDGVETAALDVTGTDLDAVVDGHDAVVNLVALPSHVQPRGRTHEAVHLGGTRRLLAASEHTGVERFVQMSGLGVDAGIETAYFRAKREAERAVRESDMEWVIYRPSVVFGEGCAFVPFVRRIIPPVVAPLPGGGRMELQPLWVGDLAPMVADGVDTDGVAGECYTLGGPERLTLAQLVEKLVGERIVLPIPMPVAALGATIAEFLPFVPIGRDQYRVLAHDNVVASNAVTAFGVESDALTSLGEYLRTRPEPASSDLWADGPKDRP